MICLVSVWVFVLTSCDQPKKTIKEGFIDVKQSEIYYTVRGKGNPIVLLHGGFLDHKMWEAQIDSLTENGYRVISLDLPGHGRTRNNDSSLFIQEFIRACLDSLGIKKATLVGCSMGGLSAAEFALAFPEMVDRLVLVSSLVTGYDQRYAHDSTALRYFSEFRDKIKIPDLPAAAEVFTRYWCDGLRASTEVDQKVRMYVYNTTLKSLESHRYSEWPKFDSSLAIDQLPSLGAPTLLIYGDKDLPIIIQASKIIRELIPDANVVEIKNTAHMVNMEAPEAFNRELLRFLKSAR